MLAVLGALFANGLITILKFAGVVITGSSWLLSGHGFLAAYYWGAESNVEMIFLEATRQSESTEPEPVPEHMG